MSGLADAPGTRGSGPTAAAVRGLFRDRPIIPLLILLAILVVLSELVRPGIVSPEWIGVELRAAVPLAILAGCQTLTMLTGGIDLSVGAVASMAGFVVATLVSGPGTPAGIGVALAVAALVGLVTGIGVGVFRVHPLIMTLGRAWSSSAWPTSGSCRWSRRTRAQRPSCGGWGRSSPSASCRSASWCSSRWPP
jgi:ribose/xylose/arabinose/galactoside ABC-type transport system permease subunit